MTSFIFHIKIKDIKMTVSDASEISGLQCSANMEKFSFKYLLHSRICTIPDGNTLILVFACALCKF